MVKEDVWRGSRQGKVGCVLEHVRKDRNDGICGDEYATIGWGKPDKLYGPARCGGGCGTGGAGDRKMQSVAVDLDPSHGPRGGHMYSGFDRPWPLTDTVPASIASAVTNGQHHMHTTSIQQKRNTTVIDGVIRLLVDEAPTIRDRIAFPSSPRTWQDTGHGPRVCCNYYPSLQCHVRNLFFRGSLV